MHNLEILIPITLFLSWFGLGYMYFKTRNSERLALIEKGVDISIFKDKKPNEISSKTTLKIGMLFIGIALGILIGSLLDTYTGLEEASYFSMILLFGGISLVLNDFIEKKRENKEKK